MTAPRYPQALWRPLGPQAEPPIDRYDLIILHTMVMSLWECDAYFRREGFGGTEAHLGVGHDGETIQWQDLGFAADANLDAWDRAISIETADRGAGFPDWDPGDGSAVPAWTDAQVGRLAELVAWLCGTFDIPCELVPDSLPHRRGIGWHRLGVESRPPHRAGFRVPGGERWSQSEGKVCPGSRRIAQIPEVVGLAKIILAGGAVLEEEEDMPTLEEIQRITREVQNGRVEWLAPLAPGQSRTYPMPNRTGAARAAGQMWITFAGANHEFEAEIRLDGKLRRRNGAIEGLWQDGDADVWSQSLPPLTAGAWTPLPFDTAVLQVTNRSVVEVQPMLEIGPR